jgi:C4-dicarboxylate-specific signal transduction histidine kinase
LEAKKIPTAPPRIAVWLAAVIAVLAVTLIALQARAREAAINSVGRASAPTAVSYGILVQSEIEKQRLVPFILANDPDVLAALIPGPQGDAGLAAARAALNRKFALLCAGTTAGVIYALDDKGLSVAASNYDTPTSFVGQDYSFRPYFKIARVAGDAEYFASGVVSHLAGLFISHRVLHQGKFAGVAVVKVQFQNLESTWASLGANVMVVDEHGVVIITDTDAWRFHALHKLPAAMRQSLQASAQYGRAPLSPLPFTWQDDHRLVTVGGQNFLAVTAQIPSTRWTLYLLEPLDQALAGARQSAEFNAILITVVILGLGAFFRLQLQQYFQAKAVTEEMRLMAITDALTQLPNRRAFETNLQQLWQTGPRARSPLAALMVDVDHFKLYNDFYGHQAGDECLRIIAGILRQSQARRRPGRPLWRRGIHPPAPQYRPCRRHAGRRNRPVLDPGAEAAARRGAGQGHRHRQHRRRRGGAQPGRPAGNADRGRRPRAIRRQECRPGPHCPRGVGQGKAK